MKRTILTLTLLILCLALGCSKPAAPPPPPAPPTISIKVFVLRDWNDEGQSPQNRVGYAYSDNHIRDLVNDMINRSHILAGTKLSFSWTGQQVNEFLRDLGATHL